MRLATLLSLLFCASPALAEVPKLDFETIELVNCEVRLDRELLAEQKQIVADVEVMVTAIHAYERPSTLDPEAASKRWVTALAGLLGIPNDDPRLPERQASLEEGLTRAVSLHFELADRPVIYVLATTTMHPDTAAW